MIISLFFSPHFDLTILIVSFETSTGASPSFSLSLCSCRVSLFGDARISQGQSTICALSFGPSSYPAHMLSYYFFKPGISCSSHSGFPGSSIYNIHRVARFLKKKVEVYHINNGICNLLKSL